MSKSEKCFIALSVLLFLIGPVIGDEPSLEQRKFMNMYIELPLLVLTIVSFAGVIYNSYKYKKMPKGITLILFVVVVLILGVGKFIFD
jgi:FtsH-binding integral membrane protein